MSSVLTQESLLPDAEIESLRPGSTTRWNPAAAARYLTGVHYGGSGQRICYHAIERPADATTAESAAGQPTSAQTAVCGRLVQVSPRHGTYDRMDTAIRSGLCRFCAWTVAAATGSTGREVALLTPGPREAGAFARAGADPMLTAAICQAILAASTGQDASYGPDHPATIQLLAHVSRHRPVLLLPEECSEDPYSCGHQTDPDGHCTYPDATAACGACTLYAGGWAGEWEGNAMPECTVTAPCSVLRTLAGIHRLACR